MESKVSDEIFATVLSTQKQQLASKCW